MTPKVQSHSIIKPLLDKVLSMLLNTITQCDRFITLQLHKYLWQKCCPWKRLRVRRTRKFVLIITIGRLKLVCKYYQNIALKCLGLILPGSIWNLHVLSMPARDPLGAQFTYKSSTYPGCTPWGTLNSIYTISRVFPSTIKITEANRQYIFIDSTG